MISRNPQNPPFESQKKLAEFLIIEGLFKDGHKFESRRCRGEALQTLSMLKCKEDVYIAIGKEVGKIMEKASWRKQNSWFVKIQNKRDKDAKVGFKNLSATCYINSLLQQLYYIQ
jgi:ubiquitin C-terminal hydrolase